MDVLFVDDNDETRRLYDLFFRLEKVNAQMAVNGAEAVEVVQAATKPFDIIVLDVEMPIMDGWSAVEAIRAQPHGRNVPIVMFTAHNTLTQKNRAAELRVAAFATKPLFPGELLELLHTVIEAHSS